MLESRKSRWHRNALCLHSHPVSQTVQVANLVRHHVPIERLEVGRDAFGKRAALVAPREQPSQDHASGLHADLQYTWSAA